MLQPGPRNPSKPQGGRRYLQPVDSPTGGAGNHLAEPESGQHLRPNTLKPAEHAVSRLEAGLNRQELFLKRPASVRRDLGASLPLRLAVGLDDLVGGSRVAREVLCTRKEEKEEKNTKSESEPNGKRQAPPPANRWSDWGCGESPRQAKRRPAPALRHAEAGGACGAPAEGGPESPRAAPPTTGERLARSQRQPAFVPRGGPRRPGWQR